MCAEIDARSSEVGPELLSSQVSARAFQIILKNNYSMLNYKPDQQLYFAIRQRFREFEKIAKFLKRRRFDAALQ